MRTFLFVSGAALALCCGAAPIWAQSADILPAMQKTAYQAWAHDQQVKYDAWPADYQAYFWTLSANQQKGWMMLTDAQHKQIFDLAPEARVTTWASIEGQMAGAPPAQASNNPAQATMQTQANPRGEVDASAVPPNPQTAAAGVQPAMPADPSYQAGPYKGALTQAPDAAMNKVYPLCSRTVTDSCQNPSEAGRSGSGARRAKRTIPRPS